MVRRDPADPRFSVRQYFDQAGLAIADVHGYPDPELLASVGALAEVPLEDAPGRGWTPHRLAYDLGLWIGHLSARYRIREHYALCQLVCEQGLLRIKRPEI